MRTIIMCSMLLVFASCSPEEEQQQKHEEPNDTTGTGGSGFRADTSDRQHGGGFRQARYESGIRIDAYIQKVSETTCEGKLGSIFPFFNNLKQTKEL